ncbi:MAG TPA: segregation/condensation protein A [Spirochaetota bacterium]|nr:segregation/condensation protein A [Spirochaetota bacterium]HOM39153.1 segregation/condensation protein A [Spirochaetota bacterium]HPQ48330.1 segregation/condensation protein A [Spirochaetota bacterium]
MDYKIKLPFFEGPLDLMLHLIREKELDINEISVSLITKDFLEYVEYYKNIDHNQLSEFLYMASYLIYLKTYTLLPFSTEIQEDGIVEDPRKALVNQLIEYQLLKKMYGYLRSIEDRSLLRKESIILQEIKSYFEYSESELDDLIATYLRIFSPIKNKKTIIGRVRYIVENISEKMKWLKNILRRLGRVSFFKISYGLIKPQRLILFQASLEMAKQEEIYLTQDRPFSDIVIEKGKNIDGKKEEIA